MAKNFTRPAIASPIYVDSVTGEPVMNVAGDLSIATGFNIGVYDYVAVDTTSSTTLDTYVFKTGGSGGTTVATVVLAYSDATTKEVLTSVTKS